MFARVIAVSLFTLLSGALPAFAHDHVIDQQCDGERSGAWSVPHLAPIGQEFTPGMARMDVVLVELFNHTGAAVPGEVFVRVHVDSMGGPVVGVSDTVSVPYAFAGQVHLDFGEPAPLQIGRTHVLELVQLPGGANVMVAGVDPPTYAGGRMVQGNVPMEGLDLVFATGLDAALPVQTTSWGRLKHRWR